MALSSKFSSEFVTLTKAVAQTPDDYYMKVETLSLLMQIKALAVKGDAMAQYKLAQAYPKNSASYHEWMQASAQQGFTNAMLALSTTLAETGTVPNLRKAANYLVQIFRSDDTFIKNEAAALIERNRLLSVEVSRQTANKGVSLAAGGFFASGKNVHDGKVETAQNRPTY